ncbi:MAG TPA: AAA family ATPase [Defluviitaleaceae bacterium]|nr:ParA family protein [Candidatus Epulonipiscium sp.]HOQ15855.1 AAA family ATPase [Defluviitaleaceae bacterium]HPT76307.1 AAA family ATPase [Defluviitaleaceae bacterium]HQD50035.1 AAA family ATPase [Defluviitaleaceae bacterium]
MGTTIAVFNQKGGVGKTTTTVNVSAGLAEKGAKVLAVDIDPQGNTTSGLGVDKNKLKKTIYDVLLGDLSMKEVKKPTPMKNLDLIPSNMDLAGAEIELLDINKREYILRKNLEDIKNDYDYILVDCPPAVNILTLNALAAANSVLVPIQCEYYALEGLTHLISTIKLVQQRINPELYIEGIIFTMYDARTNLSLQVVEEVKRYFPKEIYTTLIPRNVRLGEAPSHGLPIMLYDEKSKGAESYRLLVEEILERKEA